MFLYSKFASPSPRGIEGLFLGPPHLSHWEGGEARDTSCFLWPPAAQHWAGQGRVFTEGLRADGKGAPIPLQFCHRVVWTRAACDSDNQTPVLGVVRASENTGRGHWEVRSTW